MHQLKWKTAHFLSIFHKFADDSNDTKLATVGSSITRQRDVPNVVTLAAFV